MNTNANTNDSANVDTNVSANVDTNVNHDSFLYELNFEKLREHKDFAHDDKQFKEEVLDKLEFIITVDE